MRIRNILMASALAVSLQVSATDVYVYMSNNFVPITSLGNPSYFDGCWTGRFIIVTPKEWIRNSLFAQVGKLPPLEEVTHIVPPVALPATLPQVINQ